MHRLNQVFLATVVVLGLLGGFSAGEYTRTLGDVEDAGLVKQQIETELRSAAVEDGRFVLTVRIHNPTRFRLALNGAYTVVSSDGDRITYGTIVNHGSIPEAVPPRDSVRVTYAFALSDSQATRLERALERGPVHVEGTHALQLHDTKFSASFSGEVGGP